MAVRASQDYEMTTDRQVNCEYNIRSSNFDAGTDITMNTAGGTYMMELSKQEMGT